MTRAVVIAVAVVALVLFDPTIGRADGWFETSAYCYGRTTVDGTPVRRGIAAAGPAYRFGSVFDVPGYGSAIVHDRGGAIHNGALDLYFPSCSEAIQWGRRRLWVRELGVVTDQAVWLERIAEVVYWDVDAYVRKTIWNTPRGSVVTFDVLPVAEGDPVPEHAL